jgi:ATP-dependent RNA helicase DeaD
MEEVESGTTVEPTVSPAVATTAPTEIRTFEDMGLRAEVMQALTEMGFIDPMPVQQAVWPIMIAGRDVMVQSRTGSGKTAAFGIPLAQGLVSRDGGVQALCLAPTRELALQVAKECEKISQYVGLSVVPVYGGAPMGKQIELLKAGAQIVSGTPGRVLDHLRRGTLKLDGLKVLILDECDEMLSMGFLEEITDIIKRCPVDRQTVLFSATIPDDIERIGSRYMRSPEKIALSADFVGVHEIHHVYYLVSGMGRTRDLVRVIEREKPESAIIFCNTREDTSLVAEFLRRHGYDAEAISSDLTQKDRERVMGRMKEKNLKFLVATDIAARGIDISDLGHVINYTFPESAEVYVHRTGRTGRAGKSGIAISLVSPRELGNFYMLKLTYKIRPEERTLPSEAEARAQKEEARLTELKKAVGDADPGLEWRQLAKRLLASEDAEKLVARMIEAQLRPPAPRSVPHQHEEPVTDGFPSATAAPAKPEARSEEPDEPRRERRSRRGRRDERRDERRAERAEKPQPKGPQKSGPKPSAGPDSLRSPAPKESRVQGTIDTSDGREFWEAWVDSKSEPAGGAAEASASPPERTGEEPAPERRERPERRPRPDRPERPALETGQVRLYLNLGRRDRLDDASLAAFLGEKGVSPIRSELHSSHTYLISTEENEAQIVAALAGQKHGERDVICERARK